MSKIRRKIHVVGINSFEFQELSSTLQKLFFKTYNIAVPESYLSNIKLWAENDTNQEKLFFASSSNSKLIDWLKSQKEDVILISRGDPLWFGIGRILLENFSKEEINFYPSNTCIQLAFSKLKIPWQDTSIVSMHGRDSTKFIEALKTRPSCLAIITDSKNKDLETIKNNLLELNLIKHYDFWLCEDLGFDNENIRKLNLEKPLPLNLSNLYIAVLTKKNNNFIENDMPLFGLRDETFKTFEDRPKLLTKREIRIQILADLELPEKGIIWDIGSGCGSIGLEALKLRPNLKLYSIDKRIGSKGLIAENAKRLGVHPTEIFEEDINNFFSKKSNYFLKKANRIIIGGCDKETKIRIINQLSNHMLSGDIIIIPIINIAAINELRDELIKSNFETNLSLIQTYKSLTISQGIRLDPNNPVFLLRGKKFI